MDYIDILWALACVSLFVALVKQSKRVDQAERSLDRAETRLEIIYAIAAVQGRGDVMKAVVDEVAA